MERLKPLAERISMNVRDYYSREDVQEIMLESAKNSEFVGSLRNGGYLKRPGMIQYKSDIPELVSKGAVAFHMSVERYDNPSIIGKGAKRTGWDLLIDIDAKPQDMETAIKMSGMTAKLIVDFLESYGIKSYGIEFSGRRGFHIIVPFETFPRKINFTPVEDLYPELARITTSFIRRQIYGKLLDRLVSIGGAKYLMELLGEARDISPYDFVDFEAAKEELGARIAEAEKEWGERHLFRAPYSFNHKSWLVSIVVGKKDLREFDPEKAKPENVKVEKFIPEATEEEATELFVDALDWHGKLEKKKQKPKREFSGPREKIPEKYFPPCIKAILNGLSDGRKRSLFTLITFLKKMGWSESEIEQRLEEWNKKNEKPLPARMIRTQLRWHSRRDLMPANCDSDMFYKSIGVCHPDETCGLIKNPAAYPFKKRGKRKEK